MKALTINSAVIELQSIRAQLSARAKSLIRVLFAEKVSTAVVAIGSAAAFMAAIAEHPRACGVIVAVILPWFIKGLKAMEGGMR